MATIVIHAGTGKKYVLVGSGFGAFQSKKPNWLLGDLVADTSEGTTRDVMRLRQKGRPSLGRIDVPYGD